MHDNDTMRGPLDFLRASESPELVKGPSDHLSLTFDGLDLATYDTDEMEREWCVPVDKTVKCSGALSNESKIAVFLW